MNTNTTKWIRISGIIFILVALISAVIYFSLGKSSHNFDKSELITPIPIKPTTSSSTSLRPDLLDLDNGQPNRLVNETSPYLLQHAYDPVDWYPWGDEAFERARQENKPIFLSIGYSTCHWCHVMKDESFNDSEVAKLLNETFINIIVDREERPDIDGLYASISVSMNGTSGWPLNVMMTYDQKPFYIATYIPKENRFGRLGMLALVPQLKTAWAEQNEDLLDIAETVAIKINKIADTNRRGELVVDDSLLEKTFGQLADQYDSQNGGFGNEPKFPTPHKLLFLLTQWYRTGDDELLEMVETTLHAMRDSALFDHLGFGFHRYTTDSAWMVPHFEKMLYDQALLEMVYIEAYQATGKSEYAKTAHEILAYVMRDMTGPSGGFYAAEDADSDGVEGAFYLWEIDEIQQVLDEDEADLFIAAYNLTEIGNYIDPIQGEPDGENVLFLNNSQSNLAEEFGLTEGELTGRLESSRQKLFKERRIRTRLHRDEKILADWNGLMIAAFARAGHVFHDPQYMNVAQNAADLFLTTLAENGRLVHRFSDDLTESPANLDDYAFLTWGLIELFETTFDVKYLEAALQLIDELIKHYWDEKNGGFFFISDEGEALLVRQKYYRDGAIPSGNSVAMLNLLRLNRITANASFENLAEEIIQSYALRIEGAPMDFTMLMRAADFGVGPSYEVIIAGAPEGDDTQAMLAALRSKYIPNKVVLLRPLGESPEILKFAEYIRYYIQQDGKATAYVCLDYFCELPTTDISQMLALLEPEK